MKKHTGQKQNSAPSAESWEDKVRRVAAEIRVILEREELAIVPTLSFQGVPQKEPESPIIVPGKGKIVTQKDLEIEQKNNPMFQADFMQP